jgi:hypothetical protein
VLQPVTYQPPIFLPSQYAMDNFGEFLEGVGWAGMKFGAIQLRFPRLKMMAPGGRGQSQKLLARPIRNYSKPDYRPCSPEVFQQARPSSLCGMLQLGEIEELRLRTG